MKSKIYLTNIKETSSGDYLYELTMPLDLQNNIARISAEMELSTEEFLRMCIVNKLIKEE